MYEAIEKNSNLTVNAEVALPTLTYLCPECNGELYLRKSKIITSNFSHKLPNDNCKTYRKSTNSNNETSKHIEAKHIIKELLDLGITLNIIGNPIVNCNTHLEYNILKESTYKVKLEHRFLYNNTKKVADIAILNENDDIIFIIEIKNINRTREGQRPEPWVELDSNLVLYMYQYYKNNYLLENFNNILENQCIRNREYCNICPEIENGYRLCKYRECKK